MSMTVTVRVDQAAALRAGRTSQPIVSVTFPATVPGTPQEELDAVAILLDTADQNDRGIAVGDNVLRPATMSWDGKDAIRGNGLLAVVDATPAGLAAAALASIRGVKAEHARQAAMKAKAEADTLARWMAAPVSELVEQRGGGVWQHRYHVPACRMADADAEAARLNAVAAEEAAAKARQAAEELETLRVWATAHGSPLTLARLAEGYDCWVSSAKADQQREADNFADAVAAAVGGDAITPEGYEEDGIEPRKCPTLPEIEALRKVRAALPPGVTASLARVTYEPAVEGSDDEDGYDDAEKDEAKPLYRTEVMLTVPHAFGARERYILLPE